MIIAVAVGDLVAIGTVGAVDVWKKWSNFNAQLIDLTIDSCG